MAKRLVELKVGDTEANHQAVSKSDLTVNIHNSLNGGRTDTDMSSASSTGSRVKSRLTVADVDDVERYTEPVVSSSSTKYLARTAPTVDMILNPETNVTFLSKLAEVQRMLLTSDDKKLLYNLIDQTGRIIMSAQQLIELIAALLSTEERIIAPRDIKLRYLEETTTGGWCTGSKLLPFGEVESITYKDEELKYKHNILYNILQDTYKVSVTRVYIR